MIDFKKPQDEAPKFVEIPQQKEVKLLTFNSVKEQSLTEETELKINNSKVDSTVQKGEGDAPKQTNCPVATLSKLSPDKDMICLNYITDKTVINNVCDFIAPITLTESIDHSEERCVVCRVVNPTSKRTIKLPLSCLSNKLDFSKELTKRAFLVIHENFYSNLLSYLSSEVRQIQQKNQRVFTYNMLGWNVSPITKRRIFLLGNVIGEDLKAFCSRNIIFTKGSEDTYNDFLKNIVMPSAELQTAFVLGLTSVITALLQDHTGIRTLILDIVSESSKGKTTVSYFMASLFGCPKISNDGIMKTFNSTVNALISSNQDNQGVINIIDDASGSAGNIDFESFVYQLSTGQAKNRLNSNGTQQRSSNKNWSTMVVVSSEQVILDESKVKQGAIVRLLVAEDVAWTKSADNAKVIRDVVMNNYGFIAPKFIQNLITFIDENGMDIIYQKYDEEVSTILTKMTKKDHLTERVCEQLALVGLTADFIKSLLGYEINKDKVLETFVQREQESVGTRNPADNALDLVLEQFSRYNHKFREFCYITSSNYKEFFGGYEYKKDFLILHILPKVLEDWFEEFNIQEKNAILKKWQKDGIIYQFEKQKHCHKDSRLHAKSYKLKIPKSKWEEPEDEIEEETQAVNIQPAQQNIPATVPNEPESKENLTDDYLREIFGGDDNE